MENTNHNHPEKKKYHREATPEEMAENKRLVDGVDKYYFGFGSDEAQQNEAEAANESEKRKAGVPVEKLDEGHNKKEEFVWSGRRATPEEMEQMNKKADEAERLYFESGIDGKPEIEAESTNESESRGEPSKE